MIEVFCCYVEIGHGSASGPTTHTEISSLRTSSSQPRRDTGIQLLKALKQTDQEADCQEAIEKSTLKLIDFGLAREFTAEQAMDRGGSFKSALCFLGPGSEYKGWHAVLRGTTGAFWESKRPFPKLVGELWHCAGLGRKV